jgi:integrase/recombinase XerD
MKTRACFMLWLRVDKPNKLGQVPISCRITVRGVRAEVATLIRVKPEDWNSQKKRITGASGPARAGNAALTKMLDQLTDIHADLERQSKPVTAQGIARLYRNNGAVLSLIGLIDAFFAERGTLVGVEICARTNIHSTTRYNRLKDFLLVNKLMDLRPEEFDNNMADKCLYWLLKERGQKRNTANKCLQTISQALRWGVRRKHLEKNPMEGYQIKLEAPKDIVYLEAAEMEALTAYHFAVPALEKVRDCFIFQCWTGLAYADLAGLNVARDVDTATNGRRFLRIRRAKSTIFKGFECVVPLLPEAERLLAKYGDVLPVPTNQVYNRYLKQIGELTGLTAEKMNTHVGRKTAGTLMLNKGIPIEAVSKFLGHSNVKITQRIYAKLLDTTVLDAFELVFGGPVPPPTMAGLLTDLDNNVGRVVPMFRAANRIGF